MEHHTITEAIVTLNDEEGHQKAKLWMPKADITPIYALVLLLLLSAISNLFSILI